MTEIAVCGNDCNYCPRYIATKKGDVKNLKKVAELWKRTGLRNSVETPDIISCKGCRIVQNCKHGIFECAKEKGIDNCGLCADYPCENISEVFERANSYKKTFKKSCTKKEYDILNKAFFCKMQTLNKISGENKKKFKF